MTRRIAVAILLTTWTALVIAGGATYLLTQHVLLADLDASIATRAQALPEVAGFKGDANAAVAEGDRYVLKDAHDRTLSRLSTTVSPAVPEVIARQFTTLGDGERLRTLTLVMNVPPAQGRSAEPVKIMYSTPARSFDALLSRLTWGLVGIDLVCGLAVAGVAAAVSRVSLRPLLASADLMLNSIDADGLNRRIDTTMVPREFGPMAQQLNNMLQRLESAFGRRNETDSARPQVTPAVKM